MLRGLDSVDWASLEHAYGKATDVPRLLRSLQSSNPKVRNKAIYELFGNIWHQGTVYSATAAAEDVDGPLGQQSEAGLVLQRV